MDAPLTDTMVHASLFSGIGGFDLAAEWAGWTNAFNCEIDKFCQKVLKYHFPKAKQYADITTTDFTEWRGRIDVLTGGFPCQPFSLAGKRLGTNDNRYLWPEMLRAIREIAPRWIVGENVYGFVNWSDGLVLETVCSDLENEGYEVQSYIIPACGVGAPHRRDRIWIVAYRDDPRAEDSRPERHDVYASDVVTHTDCNRCGKRPYKQVLIERECGTSDIGVGCKNASAADSYGERLAEQFIAQKSGKSRRRIDKGDYDRTTPPRTSWDDFPTKPSICCGDDGLSDRLDAITFPAWCRESIKAFGNAIVPQVAYRIFETINEANHGHSR